MIEGAAQFNSTITQINNQVKISNAEFQKLQAQYGNNSKSVELLAGKQKLLQDKLQASKDIGAQYNRILEEAVDQYGENSAEADKARVAIAKNEAEQAKLKAQLEAVTKQLKIQSSEWTQFGQKCEAAGKKLKDVGDKITGIGKSLSTTVTAPIVGLGTAATKSAIDFETAFTGVAKTVEGTDEELAQLSDEIRQMAKEIPSTTTEIAAVAEAAGQLGIAVDDVASFTRVMIDLGNSTNITAEDAAISLARFANITGMAADEYENLGSAIVAMGNNFATSEAEIVAMSTNLASAGTLAGLTETDIIALATAMSSVGIEAEAGGTAMSQTMNVIEKAVASGSDKVGEFARIAGMSADEFAQTWKDKPIDAITAFISGLGELDEKGESATLVLDDLGLSGIRQSKMLKSLALASGVLTDAVEMSSEAWEKNTALSNEASKRYETMASKIQVMKNTLKDVGITLGNTLMPYVEKAVEKIKQLAEKFSSLDEKQQANILRFAAIAAAIGPVLIIVGKLTSSIGSILTVVGKVSKAIGALSGTVGGLSGVLSALGGPVGIAAVALVGLALACADGESEYSKLVKTLKDSEKTWKNVSEARDDALSTGSQEITDIQTLKLELDSLVDSNGRVKEGYEERAAYIAGELSKATGTEISLVDGVIESYDELSATIESYISMRRAEIALEAGADAYKAAIQGRKDLEQAYVDSYEAMLEAQDNYNNASEGRDKATAGVLLQQATDLYEGIKSQYEEYGDEIKSYEEDLTAFRNGEYDKVASGLSGLLVSMEQFTSMSKEEQQKQIKDTEDAYNEKVRLYQLTGDETTKIQADALAQQLKDEKRYYGDREREQTSSDGRYKSEQAKTNSELERENSTHYSKAESDETTHLNKMVTNISNQREPARSATKQVTGAVSGELTAVNDQTYSWGANAISGWIAGIRSMLGSVRAAAEETASALELYIGHNSPAKKGPGRFIVKWGANAIDAWIGGMKSMRPALEKAAASMSATAMHGLQSKTSSVSNTDNRSYSFGGVTVENLVVRNDMDIKLIAQELYRLQTKNARSKGVVTA